MWCDGAASLAPWGIGDPPSGFDAGGEIEAVMRKP